MHRFVKDYDSIQTGGVLQVFGLLDMHDLVESQMQILTELLSRTNSGSLLRVTCLLLTSQLLLPNMSTFTSGQACM